MSHPRAAQAGRVFNTSGRSAILHPPPSRPDRYTRTPRSRRRAIVRLTSSAGSIVSARACGAELLASAVRAADK